MMIKAACNTDTTYMRDSEAGNIGVPPWLQGSGGITVESSGDIVILMP